MFKLLIVIVLLGVIGASVYYVMNAGHDFSNVWVKGNQGDRAGTMLRN